MIQHFGISEFVLDYRSVFVVAVSIIFEGERYYGEQTLATPTLQRLRFVHGLVNVVLVCVQVQGAKRTFCFPAKDRQVVNTFTRNILTHTNKHRILYFIVLDGQDRIPQK